LLQVLPAVRFVRWAVLAAVLVTVLVSVVLAGRSPSSPQSLSALFGGGTVDTPWGPLGASDRDMLIKVRQADLWEGPTGEQAAQRASNPAVREVGRKLGIEHAQLDGDLRAMAAKLGVPLPSQPSDQQKVWMAEITGASAQKYDTTFVNLVRSAHGEVMPLVEGVRSGTQNQLVRQFAIEAGAFIGRHMDYLESTGLVDYALFPPSTAPAARLASIGGYSVPITLVLFVVAVFVSAALLRGLGRSRPGAPPRVAGPAWWTRLASRLERRQSGRAAGRSDQHGTVTTAELIAVLNPPLAVEPDVEPADPWRDPVADPPRDSRVGVAAGARSAARLSGIPAQRDPLASRSARSAPAQPHTGPRVRRSAEVPVVRSGELPVARSGALSVERSGELSRVRSVARPVEWSGETPLVDSGESSATGSAELPVTLPVARSAARAHRVTRPGRSAAERTAEQDRRPPKLGRGTAARPW
jgi:predicted outer membrane protein